MRKVGGKWLIKCDKLGYEIYPEVLIEVED